jgi:Na+/proline symporter
MGFAGIDWAVLLGTPLLAWLIIAIGKKKAGAFGSYRGYYLALGQLSTGSVAAAYIGTNLTFTSVFLILSEESFKRGYVVLFIPAFWILGSILLTSLYKRIAPHIAQERTLHQSLGEVFQSKLLRKWAAIWTLVAFLGTVGLEFYGGIILIQWTGVSVLTSVTIALCIAFVVSVFTISGGLRGVAVADIFLDLMTLGATGILFYFLVSAPTVAHSNMTVGAPELPNLTDQIIFVISAMCLFLPFQFCTLDTWQRFLAWRNSNKNPRLWILSGGILIGLVFAVPIVLGSAARSFVGTDQASEHVLGNVIGYLNIGAGFIGVCFAGLAAAVLSTADELLNCCSMTLFADIWGIRFQAKRSREDEKALWNSGKLYTAVFAILAAAIALLALAFGRKITEMALAVFSAQVSFLWPLLVLMFTPSLGPKLSRHAVWSMAAASLTAFFAVFYGWVSNDNLAVDGAPIAAFLVSGLVLVPKWIIVKRKTEREDR